MMASVRSSLSMAAIFILVTPSFAPAQEAVMDEIIVEAPFDVRLELPRESHVQIMIERLTLGAESKRALELQVANRPALTTLLDLTKYSPIPAGASESRVDIFFLQNYLRADLNPRDDDPLALRR